MIKTIFKVTFLFLAGLILGAVLFLPRETLWAKALTYANEKLPKVNIAWSGISHAGLTGCTINNLHVQTASKNTNVYAEELTLGLGFGTLLDLNVKTGPRMRIRINRDKTIVFSGGLDLFNLLRRDDLKGVVDLKGNALMTEWTKPPISGHVEITVPEISLPGGFAVSDAAGVGDLEGTVLTIPNFSTGKPLAASGSADIQLSFENFRESTYSVAGTANMAGKDQSFKLSGKMGELGFQKYLSGWTGNQGHCQQYVQNGKLQGSGYTMVSRETGSHKRLISFYRRSGLPY